MDKRCGFCHPGGWGCHLELAAALSHAFECLSYHLRVHGSLCHTIACKMMSRRDNSTRDASSFPRFAFTVLVGYHRYILGYSSPSLTN